MSGRIIHNAFHNDAPSKRSRIAKKAGSSALPIGRNLTVKGKTATEGYKSFSFSVLSSSQQMKERNKAYRFFSID
jgi:hypothetical protein